MKGIHISLTFALLVFVTAGAWAQTRSDRRTVQIQDFELIQDTDGQVSIDFTLVIGDKAAGRANTLSVIPMLTNGSIGRPLTTVVVRGRRAEILYKRRFIASPRTATPDGPEVILADNGQSLRYHAVIPFEDWMVGSTLLLKGIDESCCSETQTDLGYIAGNLIVPPAEPVVEETVVVPRTVSTGERLAEMFPFVKPAAGDQDQPRDGISVYFRQSRYLIDQNYRMNRHSLIDIISVVKEIERSGDSKIERIVIAGYASPEGGYDYNMDLSRRRGSEVRRFILDNTALPGNRVSVFAGGEDWEGLREMVEASDMRDKWDVLDIIDNYPVWGREGGRETRLMRLRGGEPYRYMYRYFFPELREATYIMIYYTDK